MIVPAEPGDPNPTPKAMPSIEGLATPEPSGSNALVRVSSPLFADGHSHTNTKQAPARSPKETETLSVDLRLLSPTKSAKNIANLLDILGLECRETQAQRKIIAWHRSVFSSKNLESVKQRILGIGADALIGLLNPPTNLLGQLRGVAENLHYISAYEVTGPFYQFHLFLSYARLAK